MAELFSTTKSLCPVCLKTIPASKIEEKGSVYLLKTCPEHGSFKTIIWRETSRHFKEWARGSIRGSGALIPFSPVTRGCPYDCGLCANHRTRACTIVMEVTHRCNLACPVCFASAGKNRQPDPSMETICAMYRTAIDGAGYPTLQLSGGEPTVRDDLPQITALGRDAGFAHILINTNGLRIANDLEFLQKLKDSGAGTIYLQFDGVSDDVYRSIRGQELMEIKKRAVANCAIVNIGVVLVPTIVPGVNDGQLGGIIKFAKEWIPVVKGVHFQPVSFFGRYPGPPADKDRITLPDVIKALETQTCGEIKSADFIPRIVEDSHCDAAGTFILTEKGNLQALSRRSNTMNETRQSGEIPEEGTRKYMARHWQINNCCQTGDRSDLLDQLLQYNLTVSCMPFQDAWNIDLERLSACCIQVVTPEHKIIPFCAHYLTSADGRRLYEPQDIKQEAATGD